MNTKHTPGPWESAGAEVWATKPMRFNSTTAGTPKIATVATHEDTEGGFPFEANARLIAKAPEMYEHIKQLAEDLEDGHWGFTKVALRKLVADIDGEQA